MKKIYLSGPISGRRPEDAELHFRRSGWMLEAAACRWGEKTELINPTELIRLGLSWVTYMKIAKAILEDPSVDGICLLRGWEKSDGCKQELMWALSNGLTIIREPGAKDPEVWAKAPRTEK